MALHGHEKRRKIKNERSVLRIFFAQKMKKNHASAVSFWMAAMTLIGHDFRPGFGLSFAAFRAESRRIAA